MKILGIKDHKYRVLLLWSTLISVIYYISVGLERGKDILVESSIEKGGNLDGQIN
jgi:hypothetical protein